MGVAMGQGSGWRPPPVPRLVPALHPTKDSSLDAQDAAEWMGAVLNAIGFIVLTTAVVVLMVAVLPS